MNFRILTTAAALTLSFAVAAYAQDAAQAPSGDAAKGKTTYQAVGCWECHGTLGQGGALTAPKIGDTMLPFSAFLQQLRTPQNAMPPYEPRILSDDDAANIYAYLKTVPPSQAASDIPALKGLN